MGTMKRLSYYLLLAVFLVLLSSGCDNKNVTVTEKVEPGSPQPLVKGELISVDLMSKPYPQYTPHDLGWSTYKGGTVEIYENFIIVTPKNGESMLSPHNWYKGLTFKKTQ